MSHKKATVTNVTVKVEFSSRKRAAKEISNHPTKMKYQKSNEACSASENGAIVINKADGDILDTCTQLSTVVICSPKKKAIVC